jgi:tetratricopeptide (TPR) repeat protein
MQREHDTALDCFARAAEAAQSDQLRVRAWVAQATLRRKLGQLEEAAVLLRRAARAEPRVEEAYLRPLLAEMEGRPQQTGAAEQEQLEQQLAQQPGE